MELCTFPIHIGSPPYLGWNLENFLYIANQLDEEEWGAQYISLNAPETIPNYPMGNQWFDIYPNGIYISDAGPNELAIIRLGVKIEAYDRIKKKVFLKQEFNTQWDYRVTSSVIDSESAKHTALIEAYNDLADRLVSIIIEQF